MQDKTDQPTVDGWPPADSDELRDHVALASLTVLDELGLAKLSIHTVANHLECRVADVAAVAADDQALIDLAVDRVYAEIDLKPLDVMWPERLRVYSRSFRHALLRHPEAAILVATRPIVSVASMRVAERALAELTDVGFEPHQANRILLVIVSFVTGHALTEIGARPEVGGHEPEAVEEFRRGLPSSEVPIAAQSVFAIDRSAEFELGLGLIVGGLERQLLHAAPSN